MSARMLMAAAGLIALLALPPSSSDLALARTTRHRLAAVRHRQHSHPRRNHRGRIAARPACPLTAQQAADHVLHRPELGTLAARIESASGGDLKSRLAIRLEDDKPTAIDGRGYWEIGVYEYRPESMARLATLLVGVQDGVIWGRDNATGRVMAFSDWARSMGLPCRAIAPPKAAVKRAGGRHVALKHVARPGSMHRKHVARRIRISRVLWEARSP